MFYFCVPQDPSQNIFELSVINTVATQWLASIAAGLGGFCLGIVLGWSAPASNLLKKKYTENELQWLTDVFAIGAAIGCLCVGRLFRFKGLKLLLHCTTSVYILGWIMIMFADNFWLYLVGRIITGFSSGTFPLTCITFIAEISGVYSRIWLCLVFQFELILGFCCINILNYVAKMWVLNLLPIIAALILIITVQFCYETPVYYGDRRTVEEAATVYEHYRGKFQFFASELDDLILYSARPRHRLRDTFKIYSVLLVVHVLSHLTGGSVILSFPDQIFALFKTTSMITYEIFVLILVLAAFLDCLVFYALYKPWTVTPILNIVLLAVFIPLLYLNNSNNNYASLWWTIVVLAAIYFGFQVMVIQFYAWLLLAEICPGNSKMFASVIAAVYWFVYYLVLRCFPILCKNLGIWIFCIFIGGSVLHFSLFRFTYIHRNAGKSLNKIQSDLNI